MRVILIRHGELEDSWLPDTGHNDPPLSPLGNLQSRAIAREIVALQEQGLQFEAVYTSPLTAASSTAEVVADALGLTPQVSRAVATLTPEVLPVGSLDALRALQEQSWSFVEMLKELHGQQAGIVISSHELPIRAVVCRALAMALEDYLKFAIAPASLTALEFREAREPRTLLASLNLTCHLDALSEG
jgi:broad specificity phosphatase PhoE